MLDHDTFLRAIIDARDDDGPRLVYADWLEESGDTARAEFIRVQCELARLAPRQRGRGRLVRRQRELLADHRCDWLGELADVVRVVDADPDRRRPSPFGRGPVVQYVRGLVDVIDCSAALFLRFAEPLLRLGPPRELRIAGPYYRASRTEGSGTATVLARELPRVLPHVLSLTGCSIAQKAWRALLGSPGLSRLRRLRLVGCGVGDRLMPLVAGSRTLAALEELDLTSNPITDSGLYTLATASRLETLRVLRLTDCWYPEPYSLAGLIELAESPRLPHLAEIHVAGSIGESQVEFFHRRYGTRVRVSRDRDEIPF